RLAAPRHRPRVELGRGIVAQGVALEVVGVIVDGGDLLPRDVERLRGGRGDLLGFALLLLGREVVAAAGLRERPRGERAVRNELGAGLLANATRAAEVV